FSMKEASQRQQYLASTLGLSTVGTPQIIVNGQAAVWGANRADLERALQSQRRDVPLLVTRKERELIVSVPMLPTGDTYDIYLVGYLPRAVTRIERGENAGRTLTEVNVVRYLRKIGESQDAKREWSVSLDSIPADASRVLILLQSR